MQVKALPGFRDFYPEEFALRRHIADAWRSVAVRYGFEEYDGPPLEPLELYTVKSGDEIIDQLYRFTDKGGREVALRPEMTPTLARMVAARANGLKKPIRWFSMPQLFRYERQQRGRLREHFQLNCDLIGEPGPLGDAEIMALAIDVMRELGLTERDVRVRVSDRRMLTVLLGELGIEERHQALAFQLLDKQGRGESAAIQAAAVAAGMPRELVSRLESLKEIRSFADLEASYPLAAGAGYPLAQSFKALESMGLGGFLDLDLTIVRGLAYYTGTVFELFDAGFSLRAICGGGRYDNLPPSGSAWVMWCWPNCCESASSCRRIPNAWTSSSQRSPATISHSCQGWPTFSGMPGRGWSTRWRTRIWESSSSWPMPGAPASPSWLARTIGPAGRSRSRTWPPVLSNPCHRKTWRRTWRPCFGPHPRYPNRRPDG
jgi:ATP phosphoribosyltransferase regulatory subunit HisZ